MGKEATLRGRHTLHDVAIRDQDLYPSTLPLYLPWSRFHYHDQCCWCRSDCLGHCRYLGLDFSMHPYPWSLGFNNFSNLHPSTKVLLVECSAQHRHGRNHSGTSHSECVESADVHQAEIPCFGFVLTWRIVSATQRYRRT